MYGLAENIVRRLVFGRPVGSILIVGSRNTDASAIVEHLIRREAEGKGITVSSAGISATPGEGMSERALAFLKGIGIDASSFRTRKLDDTIVNNFELLLATGMAIKGMLLFLYPQGTIYTLSEYALTGADVDMMSSLDDSEFYSAALELNEMAKRIVNRALKNKIF